jgi:UDP-N-acetylmuramate dehydrogenase
MKINFGKDITLSDYTTIQLGGKAKLFLNCKDEESIISGLKFASGNNLSVQVLSGGSNIIFPDEGFDGLVLKIDLKGIEITEENNFVKVKVRAGENWDDFVKLIIDKGLAGIECLSGIPGSAGATPIQNVGAYGQEVKDTIISLKAIDRNTLLTVFFENKDCDFEYRKSRFKTNDKDKYIITEVTFQFEKNKQPEIKYPELQKLMETDFDFSTSKNLEGKLINMRNAVLYLRNGKSMIIDEDDPNSKSCGSFFMNPVLTKLDFELLKSKIGNDDFPFFKTGNNFKIPAAWLVEHAGYHKGFRKNGVGISKNHSLSLININGTSKELLQLADEIEKMILEKFGIKLEKEPVIV